MLLITITLGREGRGRRGIERGAERVGREGGEREKEKGKERRGGGREGREKSGLPLSLPSLSFSSHTYIVYMCLILTAPLAQ